MKKVWLEPKLKNLDLKNTNSILPGNAHCVIEQYGGPETYKNGITICGAPSNIWFACPYHNDENGYYEDKRVCYANGNPFPSQS